MTANSSTKKDAETRRQFRLTSNALELQLEKKQLGSHFQDCSSPLPSLNNYSYTFNLYLRTGPLQSSKCLLKHTAHKKTHFLKWKIPNFYNHFFFIFSFWTVLKIKIISTTSVCTAAASFLHCHSTGRWKSHLYWCKKMEQGIGPLLTNILWL